MQFFASTETERSVYPLVTDIIRAVQAGLSDQFGKGILAGTDTEIRYVPLIMDLPPGTRNARARAKKAEQIVDYSPQLDFEKFRLGNWSDGLQEFLHGLEPCGPALARLGESHEVIEAFYSALGAIRDELPRSPRDIGSPPKSDAL
jgi:hypothetical protein